MNEDIDNSNWDHPQPGTTVRPGSAIATNETISSELCALVEVIENQTNSIISRVNQIILPLPAPGEQGLKEAARAGISQNLILRLRQISARLGSVHTSLANFTG